MKLTGKDKKVNVKEAKIPEKELKKNQTIKSEAELVNVSMQVQEKAYELFERRGYQHGHDQEDWINAEKIVKNKT